MALPKIRKQIQNRVLKTGDILSGDLIINKNISTLNLNIPNSHAAFWINKNTNADADYGTYLVDRSNDGKQSALRLSALSQDAQILKLSDANGTLQYYNILDSSNYTNYALPLTGGTLTGTVYGQWFYGTRFFGIDANGYSTMSIGPHSNGTTSAVGEGVIEIGNNVAHGNNGNSRGRLRLFHAGTSYTDLMADNSAVGNLIYLPTSSGTLALTSHTHGLTHSNLGKQLDNTTTDSGWSMINSNYSGFMLMSLRTQANAPAWTLGDYSAGIAFGGADTKGVLSVAYSTPIINFAGGNGSKPVWHMKLQGTSGVTYNLNNFLPYGAFNNSAAKCVFKSSNASLKAASSVTDLEIQSAENGKAACITFHIPNQYALHFGIDESTSRLSVGGWSMGTSSYDIYTRHYPQVSVTSGAPASGVGNERIWAW